ncbi:MAG TPA: hypothetical protein VFT50_09565 [Baekduia sp.]|nr:hypothetical protein [Baekduia sp.]
MIAASNVLPDNAGYVAAAYLVFLALILIYVGIMAHRLTRLERDVVELNELADRPDEPAADPDAPREEIRA